MKIFHSVQKNSAQIRLLAAHHRTGNVRVFGSAASGSDTQESDLDILVDATPETTLFDLAALRMELRELLGVPVDVLTPGALPEKFRARVLAQAVPL